ncbi:MAG TPA: selenoneine synthase SenA [Gammaproteobacteria bacterium]|nr:selenoneine synthase SenA [Gammaproteobacteria bacterium]
MHIDRTGLLRQLDDAHQRTLELLQGLEGEQLMGPMLAIVNPLLWEVGHVAWFHERWILRHLDGHSSFLPHADELYDSSNVAHDTRWNLPLPSLADTVEYMDRVHGALIQRLDHEPSEAERYFYQLTVFHEDMHTEALVYTRQTLGYPAPCFAGQAGPAEAGGALPGDVTIPGGTLWLGANPDQGFVFDNEKWAHPVQIAPFRMARAPVTNAEYRRFVDAGGYGRREYWSDEGWAWREHAGLQAPVYWRPVDGDWEARRFDRWEPLAPHQPVTHVSWHEAQAYCRWAHRRLPTEAEWEMAAATEPQGHAVSAEKRRYPWGSAPPRAGRANLDGDHGGCVDVAARPEGDSAHGCRQLLGNVWEWTVSDFQPYPGFAPDPYEDYSQPWFGSRKVLRGGAWATRSRLLWNTWRNFFPPDRNDVIAGFRTCAPDRPVRERKG